MDWHEIADQAGHVSAVLTAIGLVAALVWGAVRARSDWKHADVEESADARAAAAREAEEARAREDAERAAYTDLLKVKDEMIAALKEDREELKEQLRRSLDREQKLGEKVEKLEKRVNEVEAESRQSIVHLLEAFATSDRCERASEGCPDLVVPGDRRGLEPVKAV